MENYSFWAYGTKIQIENSKPTMYLLVPYEKPYDICNIVLSSLQLFTYCEQVQYMSLQNEMVALYIAYMFGEFDF